MTSNLERNRAALQLKRQQENQSFLERKQKQQRRIIQRQIISLGEELKVAIEMAQNAAKSDNYQLLRRSISQAENLFFELKQLVQRTE